MRQQLASFPLAKQSRNKDAVFLYKALNFKLEGRGGAPRGWGVALLGGGGAHLIVKINRGKIAPPNSPLTLTRSRG